MITGRSDLRATAGSWRLFDPEAPDAPLVELAWTRTRDDERTLDGKLTAETSPYLGSTASISRSDSAIDFELYLSPNKDRTAISVDLQTGAGRLSATTFNQGAPSCWDADLRNTPCITPEG